MAIDTISGRVHTITPIQSYGANNYQKRQIWISLEDKTDSVVELNCGGVYIDVINGVSVGDYVTLAYVLTGKIWQTKCINNLNVKALIYHKRGTQQQQTSSNNDNDDLDNLPF